MPNPWTDQSSRPAERAVAVTPSDSVDLTDNARAIYCGGAGNVKATLISGDVVTFTAMAGGVVHPIQVKRIWDTGTTATTIIALR